MAKKEKIGLSLSEDILKLEQESRARLGFSSRSELVEAALYEYIAKDSASRFADVVARIHAEIEQESLKSLEDRLAKLCFKLAIENAQTNLLFAKLFALDRNGLYELRKRAYRLVSRSHGFVSLYNAAANVKDLDIEFGYDEDD